MVSPLEAMEEMCSKLAEVWPQECLINGHPGQLGELRYGLGRECQGRLHNCWALWLSLCDFQHWQLPDGAVSVVLCTWKMHVTVPSAAVDYGCSALLLEGRGQFCAELDHKSTWVIFEPLACWCVLNKAAYV